MLDETTTFLHFSFQKERNNIVTSDSTHRLPLPAGKFGATGASEF